MPFDVTSTVPRIAYTASGGQTAFAVPFGFLANSDLRVRQNGTLLTLTTHYSVSGAGVTGGGGITLASGATAGDSIVIERRTPRTRASAYSVGGALPANVLEDDLDRLVMALQELEHNGVDESTFTIGTSSWSSFVTGLNVTFRYRVFAGVVTIYSPSGTLSDTSNGVSFAAAAGSLPASIRPAADRRAAPVLLTDNGANRMCTATIAPDGSMSFAPFTDALSPAITLTNWTGSGTKGFPEPGRFQISYPL
jgi:threonine dehydrogenase-like Zn-dependent dehydrogenase